MWPSGRGHSTFRRAVTTALAFVINIYEWCSCTNPSIPLHLYYIPHSITNLLSDALHIPSRDDATLPLPPFNRALGNNPRKKLELEMLVGEF